MFLSEFYTDVSRLEEDTCFRSSVSLLFCSLYVS